MWAYGARSAKPPAWRPATRSPWVSSMTPRSERWTSRRRSAWRSKRTPPSLPRSRSSPIRARRSSSSGSPGRSGRTLSGGGWSRRWRRCAHAQGAADGSGSLALSQRVGDPVVELPLLFERQDAQEQLFVDVLAFAAALDALRLQRLVNEPLDVARRVHGGGTSF